jgi:hypothetical protein
MAKRKELVPVQTANLPTPPVLKTKLATAKTTGEVKPIITAAKALKVVAKEAKNRQAIADATEVVRRAERKLGLMMAEQKLTVGFNKGGAGQHKGKRDSKNPVADVLPTLAEAGIDKNLAYRARKWAEFDDEGFEYELELELDKILNPPPSPGQLDEERKEERRKERQEARRQEQETIAVVADDVIERDRKECVELYQKVLDAERDRAESPVIDLVVENVKAEPRAVKIDIVKNGTQSAAPEIISPTFTTKGAVNQTRFAEVMRCTKQHLRSAYALSNRATFFKHVRDMVDDLERELLGELKSKAPCSAEQSVEERRAEMTKLAEADKSSTQTA